MRWSIRNQIMIPLLAVAILSLTAVGIVNAILTERRTREHVEMQLRQVINVLSASTFPLTNTVLRQMGDLSSADFVLVDGDGVVVASTLPDVKALPEQPVVSRIQDVQLGASSQVAGRWYFHTPVQLPAGMPAARSGTLHVLFPQDEYRRAWRQAFVPSFVVGAVTSLVLATVAWLVARRMSRTIRRLGDEVLRIAAGDFRAAPVPAIDDEIRDLSAAVNRTAGMLAEYEHQVRRSEQMRTLSIVGASIAHQLRNAVTGCRMALDLHAAECSSAADEECLVVAKRQLKLMESQLQRFLRIGKRPEVLTRRDVDLCALVDELLPLVRPAAQHAGVALECRIPSEQLMISGDEEALGQVVLNLLLNAIEAAQQQAITQRDQKCFVRIEVNKVLSQNRRGLAGHHRCDGRAESEERNVPVPLSVDDLGIGPHSPLKKGTGSRSVEENARNWTPSERACPLFQRAAKADDADQVEIVISDSGRGPSDEVAATLFEPFVTNKSEGAGLGLAVASEVIAAHGGTIEWQRKDETTQFRVTLPLAKVQPRVAAHGATVN